MREYPCFFCVLYNKYPLVCDERRRSDESSHHPKALEEVFWGEGVNFLDLSCSFNFFIIILSADRMPQIRYTIPAILLTGGK